MKKRNIIVIGDIHGRSNWKQIVEQNPHADLFIFIGDYFDSFDIGSAEQLYNFNEIINFKKEFPDKVILLIGNHDYHYFRYSNCMYSGFNYATLYQAQIELENCFRQDLVQMCYVEDKYLFTHAGVTNTWCERWDVDMDNLQDHINMLFKKSLNPFSKQGYHPEGDSVTEGPIWVRPKSLLKDGLKEYIHIVGHTRTDYPEIIDNVCTIDCLDNGHYAKIMINDEESKIIFKTIK